MPGSYNRNLLAGLTPLGELGSPWSAEQLYDLARRWAIPGELTWIYDLETVENWMRLDPERCKPEQRDALREVQHVVLEWLWEELP